MFAASNNHVEVARRLLTRKDLDLRLKDSVSE